MKRPLPSTTIDWSG